jgi:SAM-dependent methyltransferase
MNDREQTGARAQAFFDALWKRGDYWQLESSPFEREKYAHELGVISGRRYARALEIGCGAGAFTRLLADTVDHLIAVDISAIAIERGRALLVGRPSIEFRVANVMATDLAEQGPWDLVVMNETIYYLGWLYSFFEVAWLASRLFSATSEGGRFLMANTSSEVAGYLMRPALIRTYRDVFINIGFKVEREEIFQGTKDDVPLEVLVSLFTKPPHATVGT